MPTAGTQPWGWGSPQAPPPAQQNLGVKCCSAASGPALPGSERRGLDAAVSHRRCCEGRGWAWWAVGVPAKLGKPVVPRLPQQACGGGCVPPLHPRTTCPHPLPTKPAGEWGLSKQQICVNPNAETKASPGSTTKLALLQLSASSCIPGLCQQGGMQLPSGTEGSKSHPVPTPPPPQTAACLCSAPAIKMPLEKSSPPAAPRARCELLCKAALLQCFSWEAVSAGAAGAWQVGCDTSWSATRHGQHGAACHPFPKLPSGSGQASVLRRAKLSLLPRHSQLSSGRSGRAVICGAVGNAVSFTWDSRQ